LTIPPDQLSAPGTAKWPHDAYQEILSGVPATRKGFRNGRAGRGNDASPLQPPPRVARRAALTKPDPACAVRPLRRKNLPSAPRLGRRTDSGSAEIQTGDAGHLYRSPQAPR